jgi:hypothetical protein
MASNAKKISELIACTAPIGNNQLAVVGNTAGTKNTFSLTVSDLLGNSQANVVVGNSAVLSANTLIIRKTTTPANSTVGGATNNSIWFDADYIYVALANGHIKRASLSTF